MKVLVLCGGASAERVVSLGLGRRGGEVAGRGRL